jgi:hypothetical protein
MAAEAEVPRNREDRDLKPTIYLIAVPVEKIQSRDKETIARMIMRFDICIN